MVVRTGSGRGSLPKPKRSFCRTTSTTAVVVSPATTSGTRSTQRPRPSPRARTACSLLWRQAPGRRTRRSRSSGVCGRRARRSAFSTSPTAMFSSTRRWSMTSARSRLRWRSSAPRRGRSRATTDDADDRDGARQKATHRHVLRDLPGALPGHHGPRGAPEALPRVLARLLRPDRRRRVPSRQR